MCPPSCEIPKLCITGQESLPLHNPSLCWGGTRRGGNHHSMNANTIWHTSSTLRHFLKSLLCSKKKCFIFVCFILGRYHQWQWNHALPEWHHVTKKTSIANRIGFCHHRHGAFVRSDHCASKTIRGHFRCPGHVHAVCVLFSPKNIFFKSISIFIEFEKLSASNQEIGRLQCNNAWKISVPVQRLNSTKSWRIFVRYFFLGF